MIRALFLDIGGVLLTNGWDHIARKRAAETFHLDFAEMEKRHSTSFDSLERGAISLEEYLKRVVFYEKRNFSLDAFRAFMFEQSQPFPEMLTLMKSLKKDYGLQVVAVSNEARELNEYRVKTFHLKELFDYFVSSSIVRLQKPEYEIYRLALELGQFSKEEVLYIDDRLLLIEIAKSYGIQSLHHQNFESTKKQLLNILAVGK